ncbi:MAG: type II toxin-antitoxin system VapC family toxin [Candidatus Nanopelagicales bacterium]
MNRRIYCDSSVLLKRYREEPDSETCSRELERMTLDGDFLLSSKLALVEVTRGIDRNLPPEAAQEDLDEAVAKVLEDVDLVAIDDFTLQVAAEIPGRHLGTLDAIHVATALIMRADLVVTRDQRMIEACTEVGLAVA